MVPCCSPKYGVLLIVTVDGEGVSSIDCQPVFDYFISSKMGWSCGLGIGQNRFGSNM